MQKAVIKCNIKRIEVMPAEYKELEPAIYDGEKLIQAAKTELVSPAAYENILDVPFVLRHQTIVENGRNHYCYIPQAESYDGVECVVYCIVDDDVDIKGYAGYIGDPVKGYTAVQAHTDYAKHQTVTKAEALATTSSKAVTIFDVALLLDGKKVGDIVDVKVPYAGADKDEKATIYFGMTYTDEQEHPKG